MAIIFTERSEQIDRAGYEAWHEYQRTTMEILPTTLRAFKWDRARDLRYEADLLEGVANAYVEGVSDMLLDKRIEAYAAYKFQQIIRDNEPAAEIQ